MVVAERQRVYGDHIPVRVIDRRVKPDDLLVFPQVRRTIEEIGPLAEAIASADMLIHRPMIKYYRWNELPEHIDFINDVHHTNFSLDNLPENRIPNLRDRSVVLVLVAGHRRLLAIRHLQEKGCSECNQKHGQGGCFKRHFKDGKIPVSIMVSGTVQEALNIQAQENIHMRVPPNEEAWFYYEYYKVLLRKNPSLSKAEFAREVGRSSEAIRDAVRFCHLPSSIQQLTCVRKVEGERNDTKTRLPLLSYGKACEIAFMHEKLSFDITEEELLWWARRGMAENSSVGEFRKKIRSFLEERSGQKSMFAIFGSMQSEAERRTHFKKVVGKELIMAMALFNEYFRKRVLPLYKANLLGKKGESPFSTRSPIKWTRRVVAILGELAPFMEEHLSEVEYQNSLAVLARASKACSALDRALGDTSDEEASLYGMLANLPDKEEPRPNNLVDLHPVRSL
ncbi:hypothetical protein HY389_02080 [Candidatus Daviesbacteria bacterium]|nr:hypothetical protein [Candidatus Daviesbacteria bacterium]